MKSEIVTTIFNIICVYFAFIIAKQVYKRISSDKETVETKKQRKSPFDDSKDEKIEQIQDKSFDKFATISAAVLPLLILSTIYLLLLESFYELAIKYTEDAGYGTVSGIGASILSILCFFGGKTFARKFLRYNDNKSNELHLTNNMQIIENRLKRVQIAYLSSVFFILLFNYLDLDLKFNVIKAITTSFVAGNIYYIVFFQDTELPKTSLNKSTNKSNNKSELENNENGLDI